MVLTEGYITNTHGLRGYRVGIDARHTFFFAPGPRLMPDSCWIYKQVFRHGHTKNPELASLYANVVKIFNTTMLPVFVFDGPSRPKTKRGKHVRGNGHWLEEQFKTMVAAFGFPYIVVSVVNCFICYPLMM